MGRVGKYLDRRPAHTSQDHLWRFTFESECKVSLHAWQARKLPTAKLFAAGLGGQAARVWDAPPGLRSFRLSQVWQIGFQLGFARVVTEPSMLILGSSLKDYAIAAKDGDLGTVKTFLFDDMSWKIRWLVADTGHWLPGRQVLIYPSVIGSADHQRRRLPVKITKAQIEASPDIQQDQPVTLQMQSELHSYYGLDPLWGGTGFYGAGLDGFALPRMGLDEAVGSDRLQFGSSDGDPHLRSVAAVTGYHVQAMDGSVGHVEDFMLDDATWTIRYLVIDTRNWWPGAHVLISPYAVMSVDWAVSQVRLNLSREQVRGSPPWNPAEVAEQVYERQLHRYYDWPGYGW